jgi:MOSC domain-containing protein YiiM
MEGTVRALFVNPDKGATPVSMASVQVKPMGFDGDYHTGHTKQRQVLLMSGTILDELQLAPGSICENVVIDGLDVISLTRGQQLRMGDALFEVTMPCESCRQMERIRLGLKTVLMDRRGMFVRVLSPGVIRVGDRVTVSSRAGD